MKIHVSHTTKNSNTPEKEGFLYKRGTMKGSRWLKRYFILKDNLLFYFEKKSDHEPIGVLVLEAASVCLGDEPESNAFTFNVTFPGPDSRVYYLRAQNQNDLESWMNLIQSVYGSYELMKQEIMQIQQVLEGDAAPGYRTSIFLDTFNTAFKELRQSVKHKDQQRISEKNKISEHLQECDEEEEKATVSVKSRIAIFQTGNYPGLDS